MEEVAAEANDGELFGKLWTWEELQTVERPRAPKRKPDWFKEGCSKPAHWPADTEPDPGAWVFWLPDGWGQGKKVTSGGKSLKCYIGPPPEGKRIFHKADLIKYCEKKGLELPKEEPDEKEEKNVKTAIPHWPDNSAYTLPKDWRVGFRKLPTTLHRIYVPPGQNEGFLFQLAEVEPFFAGTKQLTKFEVSKPMVEIMRNAGNKDPQIKKKKKRRKESEGYVISEKDYVENSLLLIELPTNASVDVWSSTMSDFGILKANELAQEASKIQACLLSRGFPENTGLIAVSAKGAETMSAVMDTYVVGIFHQKINEKLCYQKAFLTRQGVVASQGVYIFHTGQKWAIGDFAGYRVAFNHSEATSPAQLTTPWHVLRDDYPSLLQNAKE